ncbi:MAG: MmgE/PrpD family protein [Burkholderiales bacterium]|nr:MmgE/PrpD family protein [Burkholderiales bacterium]
MSFATELSNKINELQYDILPADAVHWAKVGILDTVGVTVAGAHEPATRIVLGVSGSASGPALVFGHARRIGALDAALVNGTASHALDFDDCNNTLGGHPSAPILPALFALADETGATGKDFIAAYVAGFETECKLSMVVNFHQYTKGWHPTTTIGVFGAAAACAHLLKLPVERTATALSIAASLAAGVKSNFGTMTKPLHVGHCARNGLAATLLARRGFTANPGAFEHTQGFFNVYNGEGSYDARRILERWADPLEIVRPGAGYKEYPCCAATHAALDATFTLLREYGPISAERIASVETWTPARRLAHTNRPDPRSNLDAKFSVQYCVARALLDGRIVIDQFEGDAWRDPPVRALMRRVRSETHRAGQFAPDNHFGAEVAVTLTDGRRLSSRVDIQRGRTSDNPIPPELLRVKFENCASRLLDRDAVARLGATLESLERLESVRELTALMEPATRAAA